MTYKATRDIAYGTGVISAGDVVVNPTQRMIDLGLVQENVNIPSNVSPPKKDGKRKAKACEPKKESIKDLELLTEQSSDVVVSTEKTDVKDDSGHLEEDETEA